MKVDVSKGFELGPFHYEVICDERGEKDLEASNCYGKCDNLHKRVRITKNFKAQQFDNTFVHECFEAVNCVYCNDKVKHDELTNMAHGFSQILKSLGVSFTHGGRDA